MNKLSTEEDIYCILKECSDVDSDDDDIYVIPGPSRCPDVRVIEARDYPAELGEQDKALCR